MILLTGATGYIGSHTWLALHAAAMPVVGVDDFSNSSPEVLRRLEALGADVSRFARVDVTDRAALAQVLRWPIDAVVHFAAIKAVGESVDQPLDYYANNVGGTVALAQAMQAHGCKTHRLQLERHRLRPAAQPADARRRRARADQPLRRDQADEREHPARRRARPTRPGGSPACATSTRWARIRAARSAKTRAARRTT